MERSRTILTGLNPVQWEHPADKAAMSALKALPGLDDLVRHSLGATADVYVRQTWLSSSVRVGPRQFPRVHRLVQEAREVMDVSRDYPVFVGYHPSANAMAVGFKDPCLVFHSSLLELLDDEELLFVVAHEIGHAESGHALYHTLLTILIDSFYLLSGIGLTQIARLAIIMALLEWSRKSELSADRAGLLGCQSTDAALRTFMKMAGGGAIGDMNLEDFLVQAQDYDKAGNLADEVSKLLVLGFRTHPMPVLRLKELKLWAERGSYQDILDGIRPRPEPEAADDSTGAEEHPADFAARLARDAKKLADDLAAGFKTYKSDMESSSFAKSMGKNFQDAADQINKFFGGDKE